MIEANSINLQEGLHELVGGGNEGRWNSVAALTNAGFDLSDLVDDQSQVIDQSAAQTERERWLTLIRACGSTTPPHPDLHYVGGDVADVEKLADGTVLWTMPDYGANTTGNDVLDDDDTYSVNPLGLLQRNGCIIESNPGGTFNFQTFQSGNPGPWLNPQVQGGQPAGRLWWPMTVLQQPNADVHVGALLHDTTTATPFGTTLDSHIITLSIFLTFGSVTPCNFGIYSNRFQVQCMRRDDTNTYILGSELVPPGATPNGSGLPNYTIGDMDTLKGQFVRTRIARVANNGLTTMANWRFWNGSDWVSGVQNAVPVVDNRGREIRGAAGITKTPVGHWLLCARTQVEPRVNVYASDNPQGPWTPIARVPVPGVGKTIKGGSTVAWHTKFAEHLTAPAEHSMVMMTMTVLNLPPAEALNMNIRRYTPQFVAVPWY